MRSPAQDLVRQLVTHDLEPPLRAQIAKAKGISHPVLVMRRSVHGRSTSAHVTAPGQRDFREEM